MDNFFVIFVAICTLFNGYSHAILKLEKVSNLFMPYGYDVNGAPLYGLHRDAVEQVAYDSENKKAYVVGAGKINVVDIKDITSPIILHHREIRNFNPTDVEICGDYVFVTLDNQYKHEEGRLDIYKKYDETVATLECILNITVGPLPDMVHPTSNCKTILIALEGEAYSDSNNIVDPEGGVGVLKIPDLENIAGTYTYSILDFTRFNDDWQDFVAKGVRFIYRENNSTFSQDLEPEYITFTADEKKAYISLQENNAVAIVDLGTEEIIDILPLGIKDWRMYRLDASDKDNKINLVNWPVYGMYQPDAIKTMKIDNVEYLVTANEGDQKDYSDFLTTGGFSEEVRVNELQLTVGSMVTEWATDNNISDIQNDKNLGRLKVTSQNGKSSNNSNAFDALFSFGTRSFSIWKARTMELVYDSGSDIEKKQAELNKDIFNSNVKETETIAETFDSRSDDKGPEVESLAIGYINGRTVIFVGNERPGSISIYSIGSDVRSPRFESSYSGVGESNDTWGQQYVDRVVDALDPEDLIFVTASESPNGNDILIVAGAQSSTLTIFNITETSAEMPDVPSKAITLGSPLVIIFLLLNYTIYRL